MSQRINNITMGDKNALESIEDLEGRGKATKYLVKWRNTSGTHWIDRKTLKEYDYIQLLEEFKERRRKQNNKSGTTRQRKKKAIKTSSSNGDKTKVIQKNMIERLSDVGSRFNDKRDIINTSNYGFKNDEKELLMRQISHSLIDIHKVFNIKLNEQECEYSKNILYKDIAKAKKVMSFHFINNDLHFILEWENSSYTEFYSNFFFNTDHLADHNPKLLLSFIKEHLKKK